MPNLIVDFGNTLIKAASFQSNELIEQKVYANEAELLCDEAFIKAHQHFIIASVTNNHETFMQMYASQLKGLLFSALTPTPIHNHYKTPLTLGSDRLAAAVGANSIYPNTNVLCIDCGTCIKYDFIDATANYIGGAISPGLDMRFKALNDYTAKLPLIKRDDNFNDLIGKNTNQSILSGVLMGAVAEVEGIILNYQNLYPNLKTIISGGNADFFAKRLKNSIFAHPDIVLIGLNQILLYNLEKK